MVDAMGNGRLVIFEGIEGCGKSTQARRLYESIGENAILTEEVWTGDAIGKLIREELKEKTDGISARTLQFLYMANRSNHVEKLMAPGMESGNVVISDRYWMSTAVYGSAVFGRP